MEEDHLVLAATNSFHGRTLGTLALQGQPKYRKGFFPLPGGFQHVPFNDVPALESVFEAHGDRIAAVFLEPIQGEGGVVPATPAFLRAARSLATEHGALLVLDEVQTGIGRTGRFLAQEHAGVRADVTTLAKGLGGGFPIGAAVMSNAAAGLMQPGDHGCTFGGNPLACAAASAVLDVIEDESLMANALAMGERLRAGILGTIVQSAGDVRGIGLLNAVVLAEPKARAVRDAAQAAGLLVNAAGDRIIRLAPPLVVSAAEVDEAVAILAKVA